MSDLDQVYAKMQADKAYDFQTPENLNKRMQDTQSYPQDVCAGQALPQTPSRPGYSLRDEAAKGAQYHQEQAVKCEKAMVFFSQHPEFEEFVRLIRSGSIQF
jgi:hypothetical protein